MKRIIVLLLSSVICYIASANADTLTTEQLKTILSQSPQLAANNNCVYPEPGHTNTATPRGYKPFYISHYGRHGSRYVTNPASYDRMADFLTGAHAANALSPEGEFLYERYMKVYPSVRNHKGDLTELGQQQHRGIAHRMVRQFNRVFRKGCHVEAHSSSSPRAIISMMSFCDQLRLENPRILMDYSSNSVDSYYLVLERTTFPTHDDLRKTASSTKWKEDRERIKDSNPVGNDFFNRYFCDQEYVSRLKSPDDEVLNIFRVTNNLPNIFPDIDWSFVFTERERFALWEISNYTTAVMFTWHPATSGLVPAIAAPLLDEIIKDADKDISSGDVNVRLRFGHDTVLGPLVSLLGVEGWSYVCEDPLLLKHHYQSWNLPMASNLQFIFYRNKSGEIIVKVRYNEKDVFIPMANQESAPYYKWEDFRQYCLSLVKESESFLSSYPQN